MRRKKQYDEGRRNRPIATLIEWYTDKKSGKVSDARQEIKRRFDGLDWEQQKQIMSLFLDGCKTDRQWALKQLYWNWDPDFEGRIAEMWGKEDSFEYVCTVNHCMPMAFVLQHLDVLGSGRNYFHICQRFAGHEGLEVDKTRLAPVDYLALVHHKQIATLSDGEALDLLFEIVHQLCCTISSEVYARHGGEQFVTPIDFEPVHRALYYLQELNCPDAIERFEQWNERVRHDIGASAEHRNTQDEDTPGFSHKDFHIAFKYAYLNLDDRYKKADDPSVLDILERMRLDFYVRSELGQPRYSFEPGETIKYVPRAAIEDQRVRELAYS